MRSFKFRFFLIIGTTVIFTEIRATDNISVYLFPGQGSDYRIFGDLSWNKKYDLAYMTLPTPDKGESMKEYALRFVPLIDTTEKFILIGVSMGGMICAELADVLNPKKTILISSAKTRNELPGRYTFNKYLKLNKIMPSKTVRKWAIFLQPVVEPDSKNDDLFIHMLSSKDPVYLKRTIDMIINWERTEYNSQILHIHGSNDNTIPIKNVETDYIIEEGSHMMVLTRAKEITAILEGILK